jgi:mono/diheme cytochrome c family protein
MESKPVTQAKRVRRQKKALRLRVTAMRRAFGLSVLVVFLVGCGGSSSDSEKTSSSSKSKTEASPPDVSASKKGIGPIKEITLGPIDGAAVKQGEAAFDLKCAVCHKFEERYVGPALRGVTKRREPEWILNMILNPDQMIKEDPVAKELFTQFLTPMTYQNVTEDDAKAILMYFRSLDSAAEEKSPSTP